DDARLAADGDVAAHRRRGSGGRLRFVSGDEHQPDATARRRRKLTRLEVLAVDVGYRLHRRAWRHVVELRTPGIVGLDRQLFAAGQQLHGVTGDVIGERAANQANRYRAIREIFDGPRNPRHLLRVRHRET